MRRTLSGFVFFCPVVCLREEIKERKKGEVLFIYLWLEFVDDKGRLIYVWFHGKSARLLYGAS